MAFSDLSSAMQKVGLDSKPDKDKAGAVGDRGLGSKLMEAGMKYASGGKPQQHGQGHSQNQGYASGGSADSYYNPGGQQGELII